MEDKSELHWRYLQDNLNHSRHHETLRASTTNMILILASIGFSVVGYDKIVSFSDLPLLVFILVLGVFGALFSVKQAERASIHYERARSLRSEIDKNIGTMFQELKTEADLRHNSKFNRLSKLELRNFWVVLHLSISMLSLFQLAYWVIVSA